ncbi:MAG: 3-oxoacyl-[acyl-carrier-protein] reductase [Chitinophagales bacterium]|jgi:3-oxoacyl-[acyl-carrier protein] reductase|nr:3-oxoacyl-[acyl-carrier-protein] reductase [Bacteroidota bacterium]MBK7567495.1 3-oxoacyl-[acyl-carrier-protein] reductase [Bacteroidota bacterium]MBP8915142.1 3-oxoacyl-[acyl-carrier-protein] reductase [Chitinophagales bacterium]MBP9219765.1 3-oxoacyl-[acyl-carrier-protein] reductase [Chitinophagales bacterium]
MMLLENKTALITGASRGIGEAIAIKFAEAGANVAFTYLSSEEKAIALENKLNALGIKAKGYKSNAGIYADAEKLIADVLTDFGALDVVVNNAGITKDNLMLRMSEEDWDAVIDINLKSVFNITKFAIKPMMKARKGSIINISSIVGLIGQGGQANYSASKAGILGFTKSIAKELGSRNIRCNAIAPGFIETDMTGELSEELKQTYFKSIPLGRFGQGSEVADVAVFLASDMSSYVTGQTISVCGALHT